MPFSASTDPSPGAGTCTYPHPRPPPVTPIFRSLRAIFGPFRATFSPEDRCDPLRGDDLASLRAGCSVRGLPWRRFIDHVGSLCDHLGRFLDRRTLAYEGLPLLPPVLDRKMPFLDQNAPNLASTSGIPQTSPFSTSTRRGAATDTCQQHCI